MLFERGFVDLNTLKPPTLNSRDGVVIPGILANCPDFKNEKSLLEQLV